MTFAAPPIALVPPEVERSRWRWLDLVLLNLVAWVIPGVLTFIFKSVDASLVITILGYLMGAGLALLLVKTRHHGDWGSMGLLPFSIDAVREIGRGAGFGLALSCIWFLLELGINRGRLRFGLTERSLVGQTSEAGLLLAALVLVVGAPLIEEIYYRGILYGKFKRPWAALVGSSLLFVLAHGSLIIPALLLLAFGLGWKRRTNGLWYTMGAHAAWNLVIVVMAAWIFLGPQKPFSPEGGGYALRHSAEWQRIDQLERPFPGGSMDLALNGSSGSLIGVGRFDLGAAQESELVYLIDQLSLVQPDRSATSAPAATSTWFDRAPAYHATYEYDDGGTKLHSRYVAVFRPGSAQAIVFNLVCPASNCGEETRDFDDLLRSVKLDK